MRLKPYWLVARNSLTADLQYRWNYLIMILGTFITLAVEMAVYRHIYGHRESAGDLHRDAVLSFVLLGACLRNGIALWTLIGESVDQIREGAFRKFLLQPLSHPAYFVAQALGPKTITWLLTIATVLTCRALPGFGALLPGSSWMIFLPALALAYVLTLQLYLGIVYLGFWIEEAAFLNIAFNIGVGVFSGTLMPLSWLPQSLQSFLRYTPFPLIGHFPLRAGLGQLDAAQAARYGGAALVWVALLSVILEVLRRRGFARYEAHGG